MVPELIELKQQMFANPELSTTVPQHNGPLGVVGGMGSNATAHFLQVLAEKSPAKEDQKHIPYIVLSLPNIPDRSTAIVGNGKSPKEDICERISWLEAAGCEAIVVPCNTAHHWQAEFSDSMSIKFISIVDATRRSIETFFGKPLRELNTLSLGTLGTLNAEIYPSMPTQSLSQAKIDCYQQMLEEADNTIRFFKSGKLRCAKSKFRDLISTARTYSPDAIILGCSELSALATDIESEQDIFDPIRSLACECVDWWYGCDNHCSDSYLLPTQGDELWVR